MSTLTPIRRKKRDWRKHFKDSPNFKLNKNHPQPTVFVAMSGGVDSSVTAYLLKQQGYQIVGVFMKNWSFPEIPLKHCQLLKDYQDMVKVCRFLKVPYLVFNFEKEYKKRVMERFFAEYKTDRTPNPDILCNTEIKFDLFLKKALAMGADLMATGHHIRVRKDKTKYHLLKGKDPIKDQTYFVYNLTQNQLSKCLFPIGEYKKSQIREIAQAAGLPTASKRDSQGICFIGNIDVKSFLKTRLPEKTGEIIDLDGKILGHHEGAWFYTVGQRRVAGLAGQVRPLYVVDTDVKKNLVIVGPDKATYRRGVVLEKFHLIDKTYSMPTKLKAKPRYGPELYIGELHQANRHWQFIFNRPQRALTPGQSLVIYDRDICLGGGVIKSVIY
ncbi:MAG: tRNA 2-thiouridine(34) synthase MnmA [Patescibacteria group bacterium]|nr:tRNA 2-thiouridine(34) synthase MnmA [Patescibacteria group bacterium]